MSSRSKMKRRAFLGQSSAAVAVGAAGWSSTRQVANACDDSKRKPRSEGRCDPHELAHEHFCDHIGCKFVVHSEVGGHGRGIATLVLVACEKQRLHPNDARPVHARQEPFSLLFVALRGTDLDTATYRVEHPTLGEYDLFLHEVRTEEHSHWKVFEATFS